MTLANETFEKHKQAAQGGVKEVLQPAQEQLAKLALNVLKRSRKSASAGQVRDQRASEADGRGRRLQQQDHPESTDGARASPKNARPLG